MIIARAIIKDGKSSYNENTPSLGTVNHKTSVYCEDENTVDSIVQITDVADMASVEARL